MSKGPRPPKNDRPTITTRDPGPDVIVDTVPDTCWTFALVGKTAPASKVESNTPATGTIHGRQVLVSANGETIGSAPNDVAKQMIEAVKETRKKLRGKVLSNGKRRSDTLVELCLRK